MQLKLVILTWVFSFLLRNFYYSWFISALVFFYSIFPFYFIFFYNKPSLLVDHIYTHGIMKLLLYFLWKTFLHLSVLRFFFSFTFINLQRKQTFFFFVCTNFWQLTKVIFTCHSIHTVKYSPPKRCIILQV